jgi:hypothetical protein
MAHSEIVAETAALRESRPTHVAPSPLFKADRPRAIDRYIDYFGDGYGRTAVWRRNAGRRTTTP